MNRGAGLAVLPTLAIAAVAAIVLLPGCTDLSSLPTEPLAQNSDDTGAWTPVLAPLTQWDMNAVWGMDADDMWFVGDRGVILHYDGRTLVRHEIDTSAWLEDVHGCAGDEVWAVGENTVLRWDGRSWSVVAADDWQMRYAAVLCEAPDRVYVGGYRYAPPGVRQAVVRLFTGRGWKEWIHPSPSAAVLKLWRPRPDALLHAVVEDSTRHVYRLDGASWELVDCPDTPLDADGDLLLCRDETVFDAPSALYRLEPDAGLTPLCDEIYADRIRRGRAPLLGFERGLQYEFHCSGRNILNATPTEILDFALPERPGAAARSIFVTGREGLVLVGGWRDDWRVDWRRLSPVESYYFTGPIAGDDERLFIPFYDIDSRGLFVIDAAGWHVETFDFRPEGVLMLPGGDLLTWNEAVTNEWGPVRLRARDGTWRDLPETERNTRGMWGTRADDLVAMTVDGEFLVLEGDHWVVRDELGGTCTWFEGVAADRLYARVALRGTDLRRLVAFDGSTWRDITPPGMATVDQCYLGRFTETIYVSGWTGDDRIYRRQRNGQWAPFEEAEGDFFPIYRLREGADGGLYLRNSYEIRRWYPGGWKTTYHFDGSTDLFDVHPERGVHVVTGDNRIFHHPYVPR